MSTYIKNTHFQELMESIKPINIDLRRTQKGSWIASFRGDTSKKFPKEFIPGEVLRKNRDDALQAIDVIATKFGYTIGNRIEILRIGEPYNQCYMDNTSFAFNKIKDMLNKIRDKGEDLRIAWNHDKGIITLSNGIWEKVVHCGDTVILHNSAITVNKNDDRISS